MRYEEEAGGEEKTTNDFSTMLFLKCLSPYKAFKKTHTYNVITYGYVPTCGIP